MADPVLSVREHLLADATVTALVGTRIFGKQLPDDPGYPAVRLLRVGGPFDFEGHIDEANVQVDVYGNDETDTVDAAEAVRASLYRMVGRFSGGFVMKTMELSGPTDLPDPRTERPRQTWDVRVYTHE